MTAGETVYTADNIANIRLRKCIAGKGFSGVATAEFSCDIYTDYPPPEGSEIIFSEVNQTFYIASVSESGGVCSITAYDLCKNLDIPFDYSGYTQFDEDGKALWYPTSQITGAIANVCGFTGGNISGRVTKLCYNDIAQKSCRQILDDLSIANCGFWFDNNGALAFHSFSPSVTGTVIPESDRTEISVLGTKHITGIYAVDEIYNTEFSTGGDWKNIERFSGRYLNSEVASAIASQILGNGGEYDYSGWECSSAAVTYLYNLGDCVLYDSKNLPVLSVDFQFTAAEKIASLSAPAADSSFSEYHDLYSREIEDRAKLGKSYGCFAIDRDGLKLRLKM